MALADRAFKWVAYAREPLTSETLLSAILLDSETTTLEVSHAITESQLLHLCNNLLVIDSREEVWRFSHLSVREYFELNHWGLESGHFHAASVCLKSLIIVYTYPDLASPEWPNSDFGSSDSDSQLEHIYTNSTIDEEKSVDVFQLRRFVHYYSRHHWVYHIQAQEKQDYESVLAQLLKSFLGSPTESSLQYRAWHASAVFHIYLSPSVLRFTEEISPATIALFVMCRFSLYDILLDWWKDTIFDISAVTDLGDNLLSLAASGGYVQICEYLIYRGIQVNMQLRSKCGSTLATAAYAGNQEVVKLLITEGANVNMQLQHGEYGSALAAAAAANQWPRGREVIELLIRKGADVNMQLQHGEHGSALAAAAAVAARYQRYEGCDVIELLIRKGADVNMRLRHGGRGSALAAAAAAAANHWHGGRDVIKFLVREGADVNMRLQHRGRGIALAAAATALGNPWHEGPETTELLIELGADINI